MINRIFVLTFLFASFQSFAEKSPIALCSYFFTNKNYDELKIYCETLISSNEGKLSPQTIDSLKLFLVRAKLKINQSDSSIQLAEIQTLDKQLSILKIYQLLYTRRLEETAIIIEQHKAIQQDSALNFIIKSLMLLRKQEYGRCENDLATNKINFASYKDVVVCNKMAEIIEYSKTIKKKSALKSALISCFIPGYGKKYCGLPGEAVSALLTNGILGIVLAENVWRKGLKSPYTIGSGMLFSTFYFSNIAGSYYAAKRANLQQERIIDEKISTALDFWVNTHFE